MWRTLCASALVALSLTVSGPSVGQEPDLARQAAERQKSQPLNNAPVWREVRSEQPQYTSIPGRETNVLIQSEGQTWRALRNGQIAVYGGIALVVMVGVIALFHWRKGTLQLHAPPTGRRIQRFSDWERLVHWTTAISFVILAVSGLILLFGKAIIMPLIGKTLFGWLAMLAKNLHNFVGVLFLACVIVAFVTFVRHNIPKAYDWTWIRKFGGLFSRQEVPSHRFNAGEKLWFWGGLTFLGIVVGVSGLVLNFPNFDQTRYTMQVANIVHLSGALLFMIGALAHIYMGTLGMAGAYQAMRTGYVDETWLREHHEYYYRDLKAGKIPQPRSDTLGVADTSQRTA